MHRLDIRGARGPRTLPGKNAAGRAARVSHRSLARVPPRGIVPKVLRAPALGLGVEGSEPRIAHRRLDLRVSHGRRPLGIAVEAGHKRLVHHQAVGTPRHRARQVGRRHKVELFGAARDFLAGLTVALVTSDVAAVVEPEACLPRRASQVPWIVRGGVGCGTPRREIERDRVCGHRAIPRRHGPIDGIAGPGDRHGPVSKDRCRRRHNHRNRHG
mmetsp:Transcript_20430/g.53180  ORF Transcript_20430/g.53180 Transcript_20430/m.53180 type:complete len:214 (+) Transcript_20430:818-1459(+)